MIMLQRDRRTQLFLWLAAVVVSVVPLVLVAASSLLGTSRTAMGIGFALSPNECGGWFHQLDVQSVPGFAQVSGKPYLVVVPAFLIWLVTRWRAAGWVAVAILAPVALAGPVLLGYDVARWGQRCVDLWFLPWPGWQVAWWTGRLLLVALLLAAVCRPRPGMVRAVSGVLVIGLVLGVGGDQEPPRVVMADPEDCAKARSVPLQGSGSLVSAVERLSERDRKLAYVCSVRGHPGMRLGWGPAPEPTLSDAVVLDMGRRACRGDKPQPGIERHGVRWPSLQQMAYLCPERAAARLREQERREAALRVEYEREQAKEKAYCKRTVPAGPEPVREVTDVMWGGESSSYYVGGMSDSFDEAVADGLVASDGRLVTVLTGTEGDLCLTVRAYRKAPPLDLDGWERVAEVGFDSPDGRSKVGSMDGPVEPMVVTAAGRGSYRLRVYVRGRREPETFSPQMPAEKHLLVVFPGKSKKRKVYKNDER
ncbi:hypothetical protein [Actinomadura chokoriensis]|uniref:Uncharacterized protein n=1 Tax=Actinomadura chokoriensis TaxID=454156 RepID=A0ABV4QUM1_9ACTN